MNHESVYKRVASLLHLQQKTWASLARELGCSEQQIRTWKRRDIPIRQLLEICKYINVSLDYLVKGEEDSIPAEKKELSSDETALILLWRSLRPEQRQAHLQEMEKAQGSS
jgi:transcriptional regulator with XRE-family HTH domain